MIVIHAREQPVDGLTNHPPTHTIIFWIRKTVIMRYCGNVYLGMHQYVFMYVCGKHTHTRSSLSYLISTLNIFSECILVSLGLIRVLQYTNDSSTEYLYFLACIMR
jgi:hypothetical protein